MPTVDTVRGLDADERQKLRILIRRTRRDLNLTCQRLGALAGLTRSTPERTTGYISEIEMGTMPIPYALVATLARQLDMAPETFIARAIAARITRRDRAGGVEVEDQGQPVDWLDRELAKIEASP